MFMNRLRLCAFLLLLLGAAGTTMAQSDPTPTPAPRRVPLTTVFQIQNSTDDVNQDGVAIFLDEVDVWIGGGGSPELSYTALRFLDVRLPQGAAITSAYLELYVPGDTWIGVEVQIAAEASDSSGGFDSNSRINARPITRTRISHRSNEQWTGGEWIAFDEMAEVIEEVVGRDGWASGHALTVILRNTASGTFGRKFVASYDHDPALAPRLVVSYIAPR